MNKEELISIIVPVYKVEKYLEKCVDSLICQTYKNLEIILVDDGSPDSCPQLCDEYAKKDSRIKVIHKQNGGAASARNAGLDLCSGSYICFVDSDDWISEFYVEKMYNKIVDREADLVMCGAQLVDERETFLRSNSYIFPNTTKMGLQECMNIFFTKVNVAYVVPWNKIYKREFWFNLRYPEVKIYEDEFVAYDILKKATNGIYLLKDKLYFYLQRDGSIMGTVCVNEKSLLIIDALKYRLSRIDSKDKNYKLCSNQLLNGYISVYIKVYKNKEILTKLKTDFFEQYKIIKPFLSRKSKLKVFLFKYFPFVLRFIYRIKK